MPELKKTLADHGGIVRVPWCGDSECEAALKKETGGKILNIPLGQKPPKAKCAVCGKNALSTVNFGRSY